MIPTKIHSRRIRGEAVAQTLANLLVNRSVWFAVMPLPDDVWEFSVRDEEAARTVLTAAIAMACPAR